MRFDLEGLDVFFPYDHMYSEQYQYMLELKRSLDAKGHCLLEMPTGTGKTVCLISLISSYKLAHPEMGKFIYCTRTVPEMEKCVEELKRVIAYQEKELGQEGGTKNLALCLSSRKNMCIHERVLSQSDQEDVDSACRQMTASWVRNRAQQQQQQRGGAEAGGRAGAAGPPRLELCGFYEGYDSTGTDAALPAGIYSLDDLKALGKERGWCPYFLTRHAINHATIVVYNYQYMLDPKIAGLVSRDLEAESVVVFDEAHNIDNVCIEALSVTLDRNSLEAATRGLGRVSALVKEAKQSDAAKLQEEYQSLVRGLAEAAAQQRGPDAALANPALPQDILQEAVPGNIRRAEHFVGFMKKILEHLKSRLGARTVESETPLAFLHRLHQATQLEVKPLKFAYSRLNSLLRTLEVTSLDDFRPLQDVADFATLVATYAEGFAVVVEPEGRGLTPGVAEPVMQLACLDAALAVRPVFERFASVVITSGTLSPIDLYPKLLGFRPVVRRSLPMSIARPCICPMVVTRGSDQVPISTKFDTREDSSVVRNYGGLLIELAGCTPDGIVAFFPSYLYMEKIIAKWDEIGVLRKVLEKKLVFIETKDVVETTLALDNFKRACDCGRGAVFLSVARGKVAEGIDFDRHYGRAVVMFGIPFQYTLSHVLRARLEYLRATHQVREGDFLTFDALRQCAQCVGRVLRSKTDYGVMLFADSRYNRHDKRSKLPPWILQFIGDAHLNLSTDVAIEYVKRFLQDMAQPIDREALEHMLLDIKKVQELGKKSGFSGHDNIGVRPTGSPIYGGEVATSAGAKKVDNSSEHIMNTTLIGDQQQPGKRQKVVNNDA